MREEKKYIIDVESTPEEKRQQRWKIVGQVSILIACIALIFLGPIPLGQTANQATYFTTSLALALLCLGGVWIWHLLTKKD